MAAPASSTSCCIPVDPRTHIEMGPDGTVQHMTNASESLVTSSSVCCFGAFRVTDPKTLVVPPVPATGSSTQVGMCGNTLCFTNGDSSEHPITLKGSSQPFIDSATEIFSRRQRYTFEPQLIQDTSSEVEKRIYGGVLSDTQIRAQLGKDVIISPFNEEHLGTNSYDITLGEWYYLFQEGDSPVNVDGPEHLASYLGLTVDEGLLYNGIATHGAHRALEAAVEDAAQLGLKPGQRYIRLKKGQSALGHCQEFVGGRNSVTTMMKARSSMMRSCVSICADGGAGDVQYTNRWTLKICNDGARDVILPIGMRVGQIWFFSCTSSSKSYTKNGQYQISDDLEVIQKSWNPTQMVQSKAMALMKRLHKEREAVKGQEE